MDEAHEMKHHSNPVDAAARAEEERFAREEQREAKKAQKKQKREVRRSKAKWFLCGLALGALAVALGGVLAFGIDAFLPGNESGQEIDIYEMQRTLETSSDLTITKVNYANFADASDPKKIVILGEEHVVPFTENDTLVAYKGTIGLGFDVNDINLELDENAKIIAVTLPEIRVLYDEFNNEETKSYVIKESVFNPVSFEQTNEFIQLVKESEEQLTMSNENDLQQAREHAEQVITAIIQKVDGAADYQVVFK